MIVELRGYCATAHREYLVMPNDAKLGMFFGVALVIAVAVMFFRKDLPGVHLRSITATRIISRRSSMAIANPFTRRTG
jgi:hypothetical protein